MLASEIVEESNHKIVRLNPKSFTSAEMYGETDEKTGKQIIVPIDSRHGLYWTVPWIHSGLKI